MRATWRAAHVDDDSAVVELFEALYREDPGPAPVATEHIRRTLERFRVEPVRGQAVVLDLDGAVVGYALLVSYWSNELGGEVCHIDEIYIRSQHRGHGYGTAFIEALSDRRGPWPDRPVAIELEVSPTNRRAAALYGRLGFQVPRNQHMRLLLPDGLSGGVRK